ncbi:DUF6931 family protein [uncultured Paludibaculum sp.]|uniref:DUF6931 family protein n=1 Tax=uncultured Paludibaculum sp. TaxID=1765020 RepID=UPI002AAAD1D5|nr:hypothetical protein [uncultured Paludibaculum sp.]
MSTGSQSGKPKKTVADICQVAELGEESVQLATPEITAPAFIEALVGAAAFPDAVKFLAFSLPKRESIWWAWVCARRASGQKPAPVIKAALDATERWIAQPTDAHRRAAMAAAEKAEFGTPAGCAALSVFFSGGSVAPPEAPAVEATEFGTAKAVAGAVTFSALVGEPQDAPDAFRTFIGQGVEVARKIKLWEPEP